MSFGYYALQFVGELQLLATKFQALKSDENYRKNLKEAVDRHNELIETHHILENVYELGVVWTAISNAVVLCMLVYQISIVTAFF